MKEPKSIAVEFLQMVTNGKVDEAYEKYVDMKGRHHNVYYPAGFEELREAMKESDKEFPNKQFHMKQVIAEGNQVAVHSHVILSPEKEVAVVHIFRFEEEKIVEMWDCGQILPEDSPNADGAF